jgi:hypothetical protein
MITTVLIREKIQKITAKKYIKESETMITIVLIRETINIIANIEITNRVVKDVLQNVVANYVLALVELVVIFYFDFLA